MQRVRPPTAAEPQVVRAAVLEQRCLRLQLRGCSAGPVVEAAFAGSLASTSALSLARQAACVDGSVPNAGKSGSGCNDRSSSGSSSVEPPPRQHHMMWLEPTRARDM